MIDPFDTARLRIRNCRALLDDPPERADLVPKLAPLLTPDVLRHLPPSLQENTDDPDAWLEDRLAGSDVFSLQDADRLVGLVFLFRADTTGPVHLGYMLAQDSWGQGYASEAVNGVLEALRGSEVAKPFDLHAGVDLDNPASRRVLEKAGFVLRATTDELAQFAIQIS